MFSNKSLKLKFYNIYHITKVEMYKNIEIILSIEFSINAIKVCDTSFVDKNNGMEFLEV